MCRVGGEQYAREEVDRILTSIEPQITQDHKTSSQTKRLDKLLMLGLFLAIFQQWCGINVIFNYAQEIFSAAGYSVGQMMFNIVLTGIVNLVFTFVAILLVDKFGRRPLMLFGAAGLAAIYGILGVCYFFESQGVHMLVLVVAAIACYAMTLAPVTWVVISEIFPNRVRGKFVSICVFALWAACAILTFTFPYMNKNLGSHGTFWLYGGICLIGYLVIFFRLPETKKKSLEELELLLSETL